MNELFAKIADALDAKVKVSTCTGEFARTDYWNGAITLPDGVELHLRYGGYLNEGRIAISGSWPAYIDASGKPHIVTARDIYEEGTRLSDPEITVRADRPLAMIAHEITRRLLMTLCLREIWHKVKAHADAKTRECAYQRELVERVAKATGGDVRDDFKRISYGFDIGEADHRGGYGTTPHYFNVTLRHVTEDELLKIIPILRESEDRKDG